MVRVLVHTKKNVPIFVKNVHIFLKNVNIFFLKNIYGFPNWTSRWGKDLNHLMSPPTLNEYLGHNKSD